MVLNRLKRWDVELNDKPLAYYLAEQLIKGDKMEEENPDLEIKKHHNINVGEEEE